MRKFRLFVMLIVATVCLCSCNDNLVESSYVVGTEKYLTWDDFITGGDYAKMGPLEDVWVFYGDNCTSSLFSSSGARANLMSVLDYIWENEPDRRLTLDFYNCTSNTYLNSSTFRYDTCIETYIAPGVGTYFSLQSYVFQDNVNLKNVVLPTCSSISDYAFAGCTALEEVILPYTSGITISGYAFQDCTGLKTLRVLSTGTVVLYSTAFDGVDTENIDLYISPSAYSNTGEWKELMWKSIDTDDTDYQSMYATMYTYPVVEDTEE